MLEKYLVDRDVKEEGELAKVRKDTNERFDAIEGKMKAKIKSLESKIQDMMLRSET